MPRRARLDASGTLHHVILRGINKRRIVDDVADRKNFVTRMGELAVGTKTAIYAWALMTNHFLCGAPHKKWVGIRQYATGSAERDCNFNGFFF